MRTSGIRRLIVVSAAPIGTVPSPGRPHPPRHDPGDGFILRYLAGPIVKRALRAHYADLAQMEDVLRDSDLDWTVVRPPRLTGKPVTGIPNGLRANSAAASSSPGPTSPTTCSGR